jgi:glycosyltransferase involved in cell wall biosynthesis
MPELYRCADVFLHLSRDESCGVANLEALATGLPIVSQDAPVARWLLEDAAEFVDEGDEAQVAAALQRAAGRSTPEARARRRALAERRFDWSAIAAQYADFLRDVARTA